MNVVNFVADILTLHLDSISLWYKDINLSEVAGIYKTIQENHMFNFKLWQAEDRARRDDKGFEFVYAAKREIDFCNQQRNNKMEEIDSYIYKLLSPTEDSSCRVHSETPGMMIDRLSILSLKLYHMRIQSERESASSEHQMQCAQKVKIISMQQQQLAQGLQDLLTEVIAKTRTFRVYHQFKMYNDPELNPELQ